MLVGVSIREGDMFYAASISALELSQHMQHDTGITIDGEHVLPNAIDMGGMIFDRRLKELGYCPIRFRASPETNRLMWA